jgi:hypothetical protein
VIVMNPSGEHATICTSHVSRGIGMKILLQSLLLAGLSLGAAASATDAPGFDVLKNMSVADFRASGLDKLSDAQIKALDAWFTDYQRQHALTCTGAAPAAAPAVATAAADTFPMTAHIVGEFHGWSGSTRVTLDNGQVWEQMDDATVTAGRMTNPKVTITRGLLNSFYISVDGVSDSVEIKRIKQ